MREFRKPKGFSNLFKLLSHTYIDTLRTTTRSTGKMMVMIISVGETIYFRAIFPNPELHNARPFKLFQGTINGH